MVLLLRLIHKTEIQIIPILKELQFPEKKDDIAGKEIFYQSIQD